MAASSPYLNDALHLSCPCEQILLNLIDEILEDRMQADIKQEKLKKRRASRALLAEKRSKIPGNQRVLNLTLTLRKTTNECWNIRML